jgi:hypothetical protein
VWIARLFAAPVFLGSGACTPCHTAIANSQSNTVHARALTRSTSASPVPSQWTFGAGSQARTFVSQADEDTYVEHGLSWYRKTNALATTPGHENSDGVRYRTLSPGAEILRCFQCHSTGSLSLTAARSIEPAELGVRCEACHGPGSAHTEKPSKRTIIALKQASAAEINDRCGACHRMPVAAGTTNWSNPWNVRHQPVYLSQSACFNKSEGKLSCITCHDPHTNDLKPVEAVCSSCHEKPSHRTAVSGHTCTSCHMPVVKPRPELAFANHWIGIYAMPLSPANRLRPLTQATRRSSRTAGLK